MVTRLLGGTAANRDRVWATAGERKLCLSEEFRGGAASGCMPFDDAGRPPPEVIMVTIHQFRDDSPVIDNTLTALLADGTHDARRVESDGTVTPLSLTGNLLKVVVTPDHPASIAWTQADGTAGNVLGAFGGQLPLDLHRPPTR